MYEKLHSLRFSQVTCIIYHVPLMYDTRNLIVFTTRIYVLLMQHINIADLFSILHTPHLLRTRLATICIASIFTVYIQFNNKEVLRV